MTWGHESRGTCRRPCRLYGRCHCGCGGFTRRSPQMRRSTGQVRGEPYVFRHGHNARAGVGPWARRGVPVARVAPLLEWLRSIYGTQVAVASLIGMSESYISTLLRGKRARTSREIARRIVDVVLAHRRRRADPWTFDEVGPIVRPPLPDEAERARKEVQRQWREYHRRRRAGLPAERPTSMPTIGKRRAG